MPVEKPIELHKHPGAPPARPPVTELAITGMTCANCARHVTEAIQGVPGVRSATVVLDARKASVRWAPGAEQNAPAVIQAVETAGYGAKVVAAHTHDHGAHKLAGW